jgi:hypothetical protein
MTGPLPSSPESERDAIAQALLDRFIERGMARINGPTFPPGTKIQTLVQSYRDDFIRGARAFPPGSLVANDGMAKLDVTDMLIQRMNAEFKAKQAGK